MSTQYLIKFDPVTGERIDTLVYDSSIPEPIARQMVKEEGFEIISEATFDKLVGNYDGQEYIKDVNTGNYIPKPPEELSFKELKEQKLEAISDWTEKRITSGFIYNDVKYDSDLDTQITMQGIALNVNTDTFAEKYPEGCPVRGYDNGSIIKTVHYLSAPEVLEFCAALSMHIGRCKQEGWILQNRVAEARTKEELAQIVWAD